MNKITLTMDLSNFNRPLGGLNLETDDNKLRTKALMGHWQWRLLGFAEPLILNEKLQIAWDNFWKTQKLLGYSFENYNPNEDLFMYNFFEIIDEPYWVVLEILQPQDNGSLFHDNWYVVDIKELILTFNQAIGLTPEYIMNIFGIDPKSLNADVE